MMILNSLLILYILTVVIVELMQWIDSASCNFQFQFSDPNPRVRPIYPELNMGEDMDKAIPVKVAVKIRPLNDKEHREGCQAVLEQVKGEPQVRSPRNNLCL